MADFDVAVATFMIPATTTTVDATVSGFGTPKACLVFTNNTYTTLEVERTHCSFSIGASDGTRHWYIGGISEDGQLSSDTGRVGDDDGCLFLPSDGFVAWQKVAAVGGSAGPITDGWRFEVTVANTGVARYATVVLFGGTDLSAYAGLTAALGNQSTTTNVTAPGFQADWVALATNASSMAQNTVSSNMLLGLGFCTPGVTDACMGIFADDAEATTSSGIMLRDNRCIGRYWQDAWSWGATSGTNANGFDLTVEDGNSGHVVGYLALKADGADFSVDVVNSPTSAASDWDVNDPAFEPSTALLLQSHATATNTSTDGIALGLAGFDGTTERAMCSMDEDAQATSDSASTVGDKVAYFWDQTNDSTLHDIAWSDASTTFDSGGFIIKAADITTADATARKWVLNAFGSGAAPAGAAPTGGLDGSLTGPLGGPI